VQCLVYQQGFLSTPFHRVYFANEPANQSNAEVLPANRFKLPVGVRANYFLGYIAIIKSYYRYYWDDWGLTAPYCKCENSCKNHSIFICLSFLQVLNTNRGRLLRSLSSSLQQRRISY
jgi:hypothetical protein